MAGKLELPFFHFRPCSRWRGLTLLQVFDRRKMRAAESAGEGVASEFWERVVLAHRCSVPGSARVSRVGFGVSPKQSLEKSAITRRHRQHARRVRYPGNLRRPGHLTVFAVQTKTRRPRWT